MSEHDHTHADTDDGGRPAVALGVLSVLALLALSVYGAQAGAWKLLGISWVAFLGMTGAALLARRTDAEHPLGLVWGSGLSSGAMIASAAAFVVPQAIAQHPKFGGFGIAAGVLLGFASHTVGHRLSHYDLPLDRTTLQIAAHALSAGAIIGLVYGSMPELGPLLGLAIVSHKGPAGYAAARRLVRNNRPISMLLLPAAGVGIAALAASAIGVPAHAATRGVVFGFAAGIFLHVAMDFLPRCEVGSEIHEVVELTDHAHHALDRLRYHAVASTLVGGVVVFAAWLFVAGV
ncbi:ZIP family metal transporter [Halocalculus aciditolerans]|uniref:ZIP family metal transporter n=1 Tax=Halocalculus aciditolerans TaxID=1383812 RepID=A0A830F3C4_9EURY|nr:ZIP family metal transporter [Halocalculus aciditolerans]GGL51034.1 ZIP family metal transporter [Halocalculus aciditolerans]